MVAVATANRPSLRRMLERALTRLWFDAAPAGLHRALARLATPLECLVAAHARRQRARIETLGAPAVPVIVVGNLIAGGAGKTPLVAALARALAQRGRHPGVLARGHGRRVRAPLLAHAGASAAEVGDEALVLLHRAGAPVAVGADRAAALDLLLRNHPEVDVVISDDGLQHERLARSLELAVFDHRGVGNGHLLPAGPLREPLEHIARMDALVLSGDAQPPCPHPRVFRSRVRALGFTRVDGAVHRLAPADFAALADARAGIVALAGIAEPARFFSLLAELGVHAAELELGDHQALARHRLAGIAAGLIVMTEKDAVKCRSFADHRCWFLEIEAIPEPALIDWLEESLDG